MKKEHVKYTDYNGVEREEDFYFNFNEAELMEMELTTVGGMSEMMGKIIKAKDQPALVKLFKKIVLDSYGVKGDDGKQFIKNDKVRDAFVQSPAYSIIFMRLVTDDKKGAAFVNGIMPPERKQGTPKVKQ